MSRASPVEPRCPLCRRAQSTDHAPFCSRRCQDRDLLNWLGGGYALPGEERADKLLDNADGDA